jgi:hypothetical protein
VNVCGRCGYADRDPYVRLSLINLAREARRDGHPYDGPDYDHGYRCRDTEACDQRRRVAQEVQS